MKKYIWILLFVIIAKSSFCQQIIEKNFFNFDNKINHQFLTSYTGNLFKIDCFNIFFAMDVAFFPEGGYYYGVGVDKGKNAAYYFNVQQQSYSYFGINQTTNEWYFDMIDMVAATTSGLIYIVDEIREEIAYWHITKPGLKPQGTILHTFKNIKDIYCDKKGFLYILDAGAYHVYKYDIANNRFVIFENGGEYLNYYQSGSANWGQARGIVASENYIYLIFESSALVQLDYAGNYVKSFYISETNIGLSSWVEKENSQTWLESIALGPFGNLYVLDSMDQSVHIFNSDLEYIYTWKDDEHPIETTASDICFSPDAEYFFIVHPWGFYSYKMDKNESSIKSYLTGIKVDRNVIYPDLVSDKYKGIAIEVFPIGPGKLDIKLTGSEPEANLVSQTSLIPNKFFHYDWNGRNNNGIQYPSGQYTLSFFLNGEFYKDIPITVENAPSISISGQENLSITNSQASLEYRYEIIGKGHITISLIDAEGQMLEVPVSQGVRTGEYSYTVMHMNAQRYLVDGKYTIEFQFKPSDLINYPDSTIIVKRDFTVDSGTLNITGVRNNEKGVNPDRSIIAGAFIINDQAYVSVYVLNESAEIVYVIMENELVNPGETRFNWQGRDSSDQKLPDGRYRFQISAGKDLIQPKIIKESDYFIFDREAPKIIIKEVESGQQEGPFKLSLTGVSSGDIKDKLELTIESDEETIMSYQLEDENGNIIKQEDLPKINSDKSGQFSWDGKINDALPEKESVYNLIFKAKDLYYNRNQLTFEIQLVNPSTIEPGKLGDVNDDDKINIVDALLVAQYYVGIGADIFNPEFGDVNNDDKINIIDALLIAQYYIGLIQAFP
ncbi:MAG: hypothetical protein JXR48_18225 [Candidatus Delongbacteria bacterium]|nr:hypothetical protein [Candidatus Delongbacteria bacterium]